MNRIELDPNELEFTAIRAQGAGGQNVNKVSSAIQLRFDIGASSLPEAIKAGLMTSADRRISKAGVVIIKAQRFRTQEKNRADAIERLHALVEKAATPVKPRRATAPPRASKRRRIEAKVKRGKVKALRQRAPSED